MNADVRLRNGHQRERQPVGAAEVPDPVRVGAVAAAGHPLEHVADVDDERVWVGRHIDPLVVVAHLQSAVVVLGEQRDQPVVGVLADSPGLGVAGRVVEDPEQQGGICREVRGEPVAVEAQPEGDPAEHRLTDGGDGLDPLQYDGGEPSRLGGEQVRPMQRRARDDARVVRRQFGAEVDAFLAVRLAGRQLRADGEPAAPGDATAVHRDLRLLLLRQREKLTRQPLEVVAQSTVDPVARDEQEAGVAAGGVDRPADLRTVRAIGIGVEKR
jgi:hypothetical protein